jgi:hypothetical protein
MELTKEQALAFGVVAIVIAAVFMWQFIFPLSIYSYAKKVPIQLGYDEVQENWILSSVVNEQERFRMVLDADSEEGLSADEKAVAQSEVGLMLIPQKPYSRTNLDEYHISYPINTLQWKRLPAFDVNDAGWLTTAKYNIGVWKNGEELNSENIEVDYQKQRVIEIDTPEGQVTVNNLGMIPQGVEVPSGDLIIVVDPYGENHIYNKADVVQWIDTFEYYGRNRIAPAFTYREMWQFSDKRGWIPNDVQLTHVSEVAYEGEFDSLRLVYSGIAFAGDIAVYIPDDLADTIIVQLFKPKPEIVNVSPSPLPAIDEGKSTDFSVTVKNVGTEGIVDISCSSDAYSFTPLTATSRNMQPEETAMFRFMAYALNVFSDRDAIVNILAQGRGGTDTYNLEGRILNVEGYTPEIPEPSTPPDGDEGGMPDWVLWLVVGCVVAVIVVAVVVYATKKR